MHGFMKVFFVRARTVPVNQKKLCYNWRVVKITDYLLEVQGRPALREAEYSAAHIAVHQIIVCFCACPVRGRQATIITRVTAIA